MKPGRLTPVLLPPLAAALVSWAGALRAQELAAKPFALVIGNNRATDSNLGPLRYADDDAVNNAKLMSELGAQVILLVDLDRESKQLFPDTKESSPTKNAVEQALLRLNELMAEARVQGYRPIFYLFYSGHGDVENNRGYVHLKDSRLWREDLMALLAQSVASENHVVIDACKSYFLVFERGAGRRAPLSGPLLANESRLPSNTGVVLSTSSGMDSHEWEAFQGGIFSHEVRSALRGAADQDLDGRVTYEEAGAFVWAANMTIANARYRPNVFVRAPLQRSPEHAVLADLREARGDKIDIGPGVADHLFVEDQAGRRLADLRPAREQKVTLTLPTGRPLFVRRADNNDEVELPAGGRLALAQLPVHRASVARRGAEHVAFRSLFAEPFGPTAMVKYRACPPEVVEEVESRRDLSWARRGVGLLGIGAALLGGTMTGLSASESTGAKAKTTGTQRHEINGRIRRYNAVAVGAYALAALGVSSYFAWTFWPQESVEIELLPSETTHVHVSVGF